MRTIRLNFEAMQHALTNTLMSVILTLTDLTICTVFMPTKTVPRKVIHRPIHTRPCPHGVTFAVHAKDMKVYLSFNGAGSTVTARVVSVALIFSFVLGTAEPAFAA